MQEVWKDIFFTDKNATYDFRNKYQISNYGKVKSLERIDASNHYVKEKILSTRKDKDGYEIVTITYNNIRKDFKVHRLVAYMFLNKPKNCNIVNHKDENKSNNFVYNLNWTTVKENINYGSRNKKISKPIVQYDLDGNFIRKWESAYEVKKTIGYDNSSITKCLKGIHKTAYNYIWKYADK
jgi:hypothetical protein